MSKDKEISATAKLLEIIRSEGDSPEPAAAGRGNQPSHNNASVEEPPKLNLHIELHPETPEEQISEPSTNIGPEKDTVEPVLTLERETSPRPSPPPLPTAKDTVVSKSDSTNSEPTLELQSDIEKENKKGKLDIDEDELEDDLPSISKKLPLEEDNTSSQKSGLKRILSSFSKVQLAKKKQIGVDIQPKCINLVRLDNDSREAKLSNYLAVELPEQNEEENGPFYTSPTVIEILSANLSLFCEGAKSPEIWCAFKSKRIHILNIIIPKVPEKEIANTVLWATKKEVEFDLAEYIFDYRVIKEIEDGKLKKIVTLVYLFHKEEVQGVTAMFKKIGFPLTGITHSSSAISNIFPKSSKDDNTATVHLSLEKAIACIDVYYNGSLLFTREIKTGVTSYVESVFDLAGEEDLILDDHSAGKLAFDITKDLLITSPVNQQDSPEESALIDITQIPTHERAIRQLNRTFDFCSSNFKIPRVSKVYNSGSLTLKKPLLDEIKAELDAECSIIDVFSEDPDRKNPSDSLLNAPENLNPSTAFGLALANNANTQNFLFTYADKTKHIQEARSNQFISLVTIILALILGSVAFFYYQNLKGKQTELSSLQKKLEQKQKEEPRSQNTAYALTTTNKIETIIKDTNSKASRFRVIALVNEITSQATDKIKLTEITIDLSKDKAKGKKSTNRMEVKGFVSGPMKRQDFMLLSFQKNLANQISVDSAKITDRDNIIYRGDEILKFSIQLNLSEGILR